MSKKIWLLVVLLILAGCQAKKNINSTVDAVTGIGAIRQVQPAVQNLAIAQAKEVYQQKKALGDDFTDGPCLTERLMDDWVVDIVHNPRLESDDLPNNQCQNFLNGTAHHFVELDIEGNLVRTQ